MTSTKPFERAAFEPYVKSLPVQWEYTEAMLSRETLEMARNYEGLCIFVSDKLDRESLKKLSQWGVKIIALRSAGFNHVDLKAAKEFSMTVARVPRYSPEAVAEFTVGLLLCLNRKIHRAHDRIREGNFSLNGLVGQNIKGKTVGVIGTGNIGKCVARIFRGFDASVLAFDLYPDNPWALENKIVYKSLDDLLKSSDIITLHVPLNPETKYIINSKSLLSIKPSAYLINTSRGELVETEALIKALKSQHLAGAALDVYEEEEKTFFSDHSDEIIDDDMLMRLTTFPNVLITSHQAFLTQEALDQIAMTTVQNILEWTQNKKLINAL